MPFVDAAFDWNSKRPARLQSDARDARHCP
jgi:hypothetical protein